MYVLLLNECTIIILMFCRLNNATTWRVESLRMALWMERHVPFFGQFKFLKFKAKQDTTQNRWYLKYHPDDYKEEDDDDNG